MSQSNASNLLVLLDFVHGGQETPGGGPDEDGVVGAHVQHEGGVRHRNSVHTELGNGAMADGSYSQTTPNCNLKYYNQGYKSVSILPLTDTFMGFLVAGSIRALLEASIMSRAQLG